MSSVTRFLRQIPTGVGQLNVVPTADALDFIPTGGNYVGNYPPGYVVPAAQTGLSTALADAAAGTGYALVRDMGKTIFCPYAATVNASLTSANSGYFRQYQLIKPVPISAAQGFMGGVGGNNFGVVGPSDRTAPGTSTYATFYLPTYVAGVGNAVSVTGELAHDIGAGGQM